MNCSALHFLLGFILILSNSVDGISQTNSSAPSMRGPTAYVEAWGAGMGFTLNGEYVVLKPLPKLLMSGRIGFGAYHRYDGRIPFRAVPIGVHLFYGNRSSHPEISFNVTYSKGHGQYGDLDPPEETILLVPAAGFRFQRPNGGLFFRISAGGEYHVKEYVYRYRWSEETWQINLGVSAGYFFSR
jgi:hypothetical protein